VRGGASLRTNTDILRLYDLWLRTGSRRAEHRLRELGIGLQAMASASLRH
jgi:hypothetical protein